MPIPRCYELAVAALLTLPASPDAQATPRDSVLVTPQWVSQRLQDPRLVILYIGSPAGYDSAHVPGARFVDPGTFDAHTELSLEIPEPDVLRRTLAALGVSDDSRIVVTQESNSPALSSIVSPTLSTRVFLTLEYAGFVGRTSVLNGGTAAWQRAGLPTTGTAPPARAGTLSPLRVAPVLATVDEVRAAASNADVVLIDARAAVFYHGVQEGGTSTIRKRGHIPGARSLPYSSLIDAFGQLLPADSVAAVFRAAGVGPGKSVIAYCHVGAQATLVTLAARTLGIEVKLYDGSFEDWVTRDLPVAVPPRK